MQPLDTQLPPQPRRHHNQLGIHIRAVHAETLHADLVKLAIAAFLRALMAKHRALVPQPLDLIVQQTVFNTGPHAAGGAFWPHAQALAIAVFEGIHLLLDDIGHFADGALEQLGFFHNGQPDFLVGVSLQHASRAIFQVLPINGVRRQDVVHAADGLDMFRHITY